MNKKTQKMAAIVIGLVLSLLLIYIGFRIVQKKGSQASLPEQFVCKRNKDTEAACTWTSKTEEVGRVLYASTPPGGLPECNLVFIAEELSAPVALGDGNFEHTVTLQPLVSKQSYCAAPGGAEDSIVEVPANSDGSAEPAAQGESPVVLDTTPTPAQPAEVDKDPLPTAMPAVASPSPEPTPETATDAQIDAYYSGSNTGDDWGDCLDYFDNKGQQVSSNACIKGYYRHNVTPTPASS